MRRTSGPDDRPGRQRRLNAGGVNMLRDVKHLLHTAAYLPEEIDRILDPKHPCFLRFDPELGYTLRDCEFRDGMEKTLCGYRFEPQGHRKLVNYPDHPCRINTYGDSFTQCAQVSDGETWQEVLAAHFREPIRNFGIQGYGVYQAYRRAMRVEATDAAAEYVILNLWDDDHRRSLDAGRWIRVGWMVRDLPRGGKDGYPVHGFPWAHLRYDLKQGRFVELPGLCRKASDLRKLVGRENYYRAFKNDTVAHLVTLKEGGEAPVAELEQLAEVFRLKVNLRTKNRRQRMAEARKLHESYSQRASLYVVDQLQAWAQRNGRKVMFLLSYDVPAVKTFIRTGERFDAELVAGLDRRKVLHVDFLKKAAAEYKDYRLSLDRFIDRFYIERAGAQVFGHYNPYGNFWFAFAMRHELLAWLDPKPLPYR
jgi:hypothetical protein